MKKKILFFIFPIVIFFVYAISSIWLSSVIENPVMASMYIDGGVIVIGLVSFFVGFTKKERFQPRAWGVLLWILSVGLVWFITQSMSLCIYLHVKDTGLDAYNQSVSANVGLWVILAIFIAPMAEEFVFRYGMYGLWKQCFGGIAAGVLSSLAFAWIHGTLAHLPVAFLMGMFNVMVWEVTGEFKYCVLSHMIYNFLSVGAVIPVGDSVLGSFMCSIWFNVLVDILLFAGIVCLYVWRDNVRQFLVTPNKLDEWNQKQK